MHRVLISIFLLLLALISCSRSDSLPGETDSYNEIISKSITYLEDTENSITIDQILSNSYHFEHVYPVNEDKNFTYLNTYWVHLPAQLIPGNRFPVGLKIPIQDHIVDVYLISKDSIRKVRTGFFVNGDVNDEIIPVSNIINLSDPGIQDVFIRIKNINDEPPSVQVELVDLRASFRKFKLASLFDAFLMGMMILITLYGLFLYILNKDRLYLAYTLYVLFLSFWYFTCFEFGYQLILKLPRILYNYTDTPGLVAFVLYIQFMRYFIDSKEHLPGWDRVLRILQVALLVMSVIFPLFMLFIGRIVLGYYVLASFIIIMDIFIFALIIRLLRSDIRFSNIMALGSFFAISGLLVLAVYAIIFNNYTYVSQKFGTLLELIVFTYGISLRYRAIEIQKRQYQQQLIEQLQLNTKIQEEANRELTRKVDERTMEIRRKNELLQQQKEEVEAQRNEIEKQRDEIWDQRDEIEAQRDEVEAQRDQIKTHRDLVIKQKEELNSTLEYLKLTQNQLVQTEKMASIGQLTAGIAHEINNPINYVTASSKALKGDIKDFHKILDLYAEISEGNVEEKLLEIAQLKKDLGFAEIIAETDELLNSIRIGGEKVAEIVRVLRTFSRLDENDLKKVNLNENIEATLTILNNRIGTQIEIEKQFGDNLIIECYPGKLNQAFLNILNNALDATENGGKITVQTQLVSKTCRISITDTGNGIPEEIQNRIFEPFFTTKDVGKGKGLGLSIAQSIVKEHHGTIEVESQVKKGTTFTIILPIIYSKNQH